jgi:hypothetical protein
MGVRVPRGPSAFGFGNLTPKAFANQAHQARRVAQHAGRRRGQVQAGDAPTFPPHHLTGADHWRDHQKAAVDLVIRYAESLAAARR